MTSTTWEPSSLLSWFPVAVIGVDDCESGGKNSSFYYVHSFLFFFFLTLKGDCYQFLVELCHLNSPAEGQTFPALILDPDSVLGESS